MLSKNIPTHQAVLFAISSLPPATPAPVRSAALEQPWWPPRKSAKEPQVSLCLVQPGFTFIGVALFYPSSVTPGDRQGTRLFRLTF